MSNLAALTMRFHTPQPQPGEQENLKKMWADRRGLACEGLISRFLDILDMADPGVRSYVVAGCRLT